jgi:hypothetical protein
VCRLGFLEAERSHDPLRTCRVALDEVLEVARLFDRLDSDLGEGVFAKDVL